MDIASQLGLSLHQIGIDCCDRGCPASCDDDDMHECHCNHSISVDKTDEPVPKPNDNNILEPPECNE